MSESKPVMCEADVWGQGSMRPHKCQRRASVERNGRNLCKQHDPVAAKEKRDAKYNAWLAEYASKQEALRRQKVCVNACAGIPTEALEAGVVAEMAELLKKFSAEADQWADTVPDDYRSPCIEPGAKSAHPGSETVFTVGDTRKARAILAKIGGAS